MRLVGLAALAGYIAVIILANWAINNVGTDVTPGGVHTIPVWPGVVAPSGVLFVGLAFTLRDILHRTLGRTAVVAAILLGAAVSYWVSDAVTIPGGVTSLALASGLAFLASEVCDLAVYEPVRKKGWVPAVVASNVVGLFVDSLLFLWLAFGSLSFLWGQVVGKAWMTALAVVLIAAWNALSKEPVPA